MDRDTRLWALKFGGGAALVVGLLIGTFLPNTSQYGGRCGSAWFGNSDTWCEGAHQVPGIFALILVALGLALIVGALFMQVPPRTTEKED